LFNAVSPMMEKGKNAFGADISANVFLKQNHNESAMGKYFAGGVDGDADRLVDGTITVAKADAISTQSLYSSDIEHDDTKNIAGNALGMTGTMALKPRHQEFGVTLAWKQCLDAVVEGLWLDVKTAVVNVETDVNPAVTADTKSAANTGAVNAVGKGVLDYFDGSVTTTFQNALAKQLITTKAHNETGLANVQVDLGYNFITDADSTVSGSLAVVVPTGNTAKSINMFEPIIGKGGDHWAIGAGLNTDFNVWKSEDKKHSVNFSATAAYKYYFEAKQTRTLGVHNHVKGAHSPAAHYILAVKNATQTAGFKLTPLANELTREMNVTPGSHFELNAGFNGMHDSFCWDLGYNLFFKEEEAAKLTTNAAWADDTWAIAAADLDNDGNGFTKDTDFNKDAHTWGGAIQSEGTTTSAITATGTNSQRYYVTTAAAKTPSQLTHTVVGSLGWVFKDLKTPIRVGIGGFGEFSGETNDALETWSVFGKVGMCF